MNAATLQPRAAKPKVAHLSSVHRPFDARIFHKECRTLAKAGYDVVFIVPHDRDELVDGVRIRAVPKPKNRLERMMRTTWQVAKAAAEEKALVFHVHDPELLPWLQFFRAGKRAVIYDMHENVPKAILTKSWIHRRLRGAIAKMYGSLERLLMKGLPVVYAEESYARDYEWVTKSVAVLNMPRLDHLLAITASKYDAPTLAYFGGVMPERGTQVTLEALRLLKIGGCQVNWECIGPIDPDHHASTRKFVEENRLDGIQIRGYMQMEEGQQIIARCHIGLAVLQPIPNYVESYPTKMFEYMGLGLPVIVSDFPLYRAVVEKESCGLCVDPKDPRKLAAAIQWMVENPGRAEAMGRRGREAVRQKYNWRLQAQKLKKLYGEIVPPAACLIRA